MLKTATISHGEYSFTLSEASINIGILRSNLIIQSQEAEGVDDQSLYLRLLTYPDVSAAVILQDMFDHWPLSFDEYCNWIPELLGVQLEETTYRLNPHWMPGFNKEQEKKSENATLTG